MAVAPLMLRGTRVYSAVLALVFCTIFGASDDLTCSIQDNDDPNLERMTFDIGYGEEHFDAYVQPDVSVFYREGVGSRKAVESNFNGLAGKFVNMSNRKVRWFWDPGQGQPGMHMGNCKAFDSVGTATFPGHSFYFTDMDHNILKRFIVRSDSCLYYYDPYDVDGDAEATERALQTLTVFEYEKYEKHKRSMLFNEKYKAFTGRDYLPIYPRSKPSHFLYPADYFGQQHWVTTKETHFVSLPPAQQSQAMTGREEVRIVREDAPRLLQQHRTDEPVLNMILTVLSCAPRVFEIKDFLSEAEVDHVVELATGIELKKSTTSGAEMDDAEDQTNTRTSFNSWIERDRSPIVDAIYRRAADLNRLDEALLRKRGETELPDFGSKRNIAESLQLVHYAGGQEYTAHHDFGFDGMIDQEEQEDRYVTVLLYLNDGMEGGQTSFPRWHNAESGRPLSVRPEKGKAVLFYSFLPDGNLDDLSQHAAEPIISGEKWLINLWLHDPWFNN